MYRRGLAIAGPEYGIQMDDGVETSIRGGFSFSNIGTVGTEFIYPTAADLAFYRSRLGPGGILRLNHRLERLFTGINTTFREDERDRITALLNAAAANELEIVIAPWNFGAVWEKAGANAVRRPIGSRRFPVSAFAAMWKAMVNQWGRHPGLAAVELMTEPVNLQPPPPGRDLTPVQLWEQATQAAVAAIREVNQQVHIWVPNYGWSISDIGDHPEPWITDPANRFGYAGHHYSYNRGGSQTDYNDAVNSARSQGYTAAGNVDALHTRELHAIARFHKWLDGHRAIVSEYGIPQQEADGVPPGDGAQWNAYADRMLEQYDAYEWDALAWTSGNATLPSMLYTLYYPSGGWGEVVDSATSAAAALEAHLSVLEGGRTLPPDR